MRPTTTYTRLSAQEREEISRNLAQGQTPGQIAVALDRETSTISRELSRLRYNSQSCRAAFAQEIAARYSVEPSVAYSERLHGTEQPSRKPLDSRSKKNMAHLAMVLPGQTLEGLPRITGVDFGIRVFAGEKFSKQNVATILEDYNASDSKPEYRDRRDSTDRIWP